VTVGLHPVLLSSEEFAGCWPRLKLDVLLRVLTEIFRDLVVDWAHVVSIEQRRNVD
jgi:hypothetical protein